MATGYQVNGVDTDVLYVRKEYFLEGNLWGWGNGGYGQLGDNTIVDKSSPVQTITGGTNWKQISGGGIGHTTAIKTDGTLWCWGRNSEGQLGDNTSTGKSSPVQTITGGTNWKQVSTAYLTSAAIKTDGTLWMWGYNNAGQLGDNTTVNKSSPVQTGASGTNWSQVSCSRTATTAIKMDGTLWVWGNGSFGQCGDNTTSSKSSPVQTIAGGTNWKQVACAYAHTAAIKTDGTLWNWGVNNYGQLGNGSSSAGWTGVSSPIQTIAGGTNWKQLACGFYHTTAIKTDGTMWSWGDNSAGQLGDGTTIKRSSPVQTVAGGANWKLAAVGGYAHNTAIKTDGTLWCWGHNGNGQLGDNTVTYKSSPVQTVAGRTDWKQVTCGYLHTLALTEALDYEPAAVNPPTSIVISGTASAVSGTAVTYTVLTTFANGATSTDCNILYWSTLSGLSSILSITSAAVTIFFTGIGTETIRALDPTSGISSSTVISISSSAGSLWMWGQDQYGQLGDNSIVNKSFPVQVYGGTNKWVQMSQGYQHGAGIKSDGTLWLWGRNDKGQLGDNTRTNNSSPVQTVAGGTNWYVVSCGYKATLAIKTDGTLWGCGYNANGQLGDNTYTDRSSPVQIYGGGNNWITIHTGWLTSSGIKSDGSLWLWGNGPYGQLGNNATATVNSPVQTITGGYNWKQVSTGGTTIAIKTDGTLWCWGMNSLGALGDGTTVGKSSPVQTVTGGSNWKYANTSDNTVAAVKTDGTLWTWGANYNGQLGDNTTVHKSSPVQVYGGGSNWFQCGVGINHIAGLKTDGTIWTCGYNSYGQLGDNTSNTKRSVPVQVYGGRYDWKYITCGHNQVLALGDISQGTLYSWGDGYGGALGNGTRNRMATSPVPTSVTGNVWMMVAGGYSFESAIKNDGTLWSWGYNGSGRLGVNSATVNFDAPTQTVPSGTWSWVSCGYTHMNAIKTDGTLWSAGMGYLGVLGTNDTVNRSSLVQIFGGGNWKQSSSGYFFAAGIKTDGSLWTWGQDQYGQLGDNTVVHKSSPVQTVAGGTNWKQVACGDYHSAAIKTDGTLWMWGYNPNGQLGDNTTVHKSSPIQTVAGGTNWKTVACGSSHTAGIKTDGTLWMWGSNGNGQLGDNTNTKKSSPVQTVAGGSNWSQVSCGNSWTAAIKTDGTLWTWGYNGDGTTTGGYLGDNTMTSRSSPVQTVAGGTNWVYVNANMYTTIGIKTV